MADELEVHGPRSMTPPDASLSRLCRVCGQQVTPWRRGWRRPTTTIHAACLLQRCLYCRVQFVVGKERQGKFCCNEHWLEYESAQADRRAVC